MRSEARLHRMRDRQRIKTTCPILSAAPCARIGFEGAPKKLLRPAIGPIGLHHRNRTQLSMSLYPSLKPEGSAMGGHEQPISLRIVNSRLGSCGLGRTRITVDAPANPVELPRGVVHPVIPALITKPPGRHIIRCIGRRTAPHSQCPAPGRPGGAALGVGQLIRGAAGSTQYLRSDRRVDVPMTPDGCY